MNNSKQDYKCETPVLLIFFNRADTFKKVFEKVRTAKPKTLILAQDGPRNENDNKGIEECRKIASNVDWECEVITDYSKENLGCGLRPQTAITSALKKFDRVIILEDDCVPNDTFFPYCEELLERYKDDDRIAYISGLNHFESWDCGNYDYFFSKAASIGAWATWSRTWCRFYDYYVSGIKDDYLRKIYKQQIGDKYAYEERIKLLLKANESLKNKDKLSFWDTQWGFAEFTQNMLAIVPRNNLICNIGVGELSTHATKLTENKYIKYKNIVFIPTYDMNFPIRHPNFCACDYDYHNLIYKSLRGSALRCILSKFYYKIIGR